MSDIVKDVLATSKYSDAKALDLRLQMEALHIELGHRGYEYGLLEKKLKELQAKYAEVLGINEKENVK